ncbi:MAG: hypothetical protein H0V37_07200 [Chloroflexia bacterium]|nr:hypothetical protein [Chloroflexia bacterium]
MSAEATNEQSCAACGETFLVPSAERQFRRERGLPEPHECPVCRMTLRAARNSELIGLYQRSDALSFGESTLASDRNGSTGSSRPATRSNVTKQRYNTVCAACGSETQVPFIPRGDRPVYCRDCFNARKGR